MLVQYGTEFKRFNEMAGICELILETFPQYFIQGYFILYYADIRKPKTFQFFSFVKSNLMIYFQLLRISQLKQIWREIKQGSLSNVSKKVIWAVSTFITVFLLVFVYVTFFQTIRHCIGIGSVHLCILYVIFLCYYIICHLLFIFQDIIEPSRKVKIMLIFGSLFQCIFIGHMFYIYAHCLSHHITNDITNIFVLLTICQQSQQTFIFIKASFTSSPTVAVADIWNLHRLFQSKPISNMFLYFSVFLNILFLSVFSIFLVEVSY